MLRARSLSLNSPKRRVFLVRMNVRTKAVSSKDCCQKVGADWAPDDA